MISSVQETDEKSVQKLRNLERSLEERKEADASRDGGCNEK